MPDRPTPSPLRLHRTLLAAGAAVVLCLALLVRFDTSAGTLDEAVGRTAVGLAAGALAGLTFVSEWVRRNALGLVYGFFLSVSGWQIWLAHANALSPATAFGLILVFIGCSAGFQTTRALVSYSAVFVAATAALVVQLPAPGVPPDVFLATLAALAGLGALLFRMRQQVLQSLDAAREDALAAARAKSGFLAAMSHEIRTPLNGVIGMTDVLAATALAPDQREALQTIRASGDALLGVISDILDFSKIEAGRVEMEARPVDLRALVEDTVAVVAGEAARRHVETVGHVCPGVPRAVLGDETRLRQILLNLLSNAVKFTPAAGRRRGRRHRHVGRAPRAGRPRHGRAAPRRLGHRHRHPRRPRRDPLRALRAGRRLDDAPLRRDGPRPRHLAAPGRPDGRPPVGRVRARPRLDVPPHAGPARRRRRGPARGALRRGRGPARRRRLRGRAAALADLAREAGFAPHVARTVEGALAWLDGGGRYAVAVVDHDIGGVPGREAVRRLRAHAAGGTRPVALTLPAGSPAGARGRGARQADAVLPRPVRAAVFREVVERLVTPAVTHPPAPVLREPVPGEPARVPPGLRVLLAEDHAVNQRVAQGLLRHLGLEADVVETGRAAVAAVAAGRYDVVLMDVQMPEMDGLDATRAIRAGRGPQPAIVALTANAIAGDAERCLAAGMDAYLVKPVRLAALAEALARAARGAPDAAPPETAHPATETPATDEAGRRLDPRPAPTPEALVSHLRALFCDDDALADEILATYLATEAALLDDLADDVRVAAAAHKLKASSATLGADALAAQAAALERTARAGAPVRDGARALSRRLQAFRAVAADARAILGHAHRAAEARP